MTHRRITASFSLFGTRKVSDNERATAVAQVRRAISTPLVRERLMLGEMYGYYEKRPLTDDPTNPPASRTIRIAVDDTGLVTHTEMIFETPTGKQLDEMEHSGEGGWSWAYTDGSGKPDWRRFNGFDYKKRPNISAVIGRSVSMFEGAPDDLDEIPLGAESVVETGKGDKVRTRYALAEADALIVSNTPDGRINPEFPPELQPRDRTTLASKLQVANIAKTLDFATLAGSEYSGNGAPIIGPDNVVESGNGRVMGIMRAYASESADSYRASMRAALGDYDLSQSELDRMVKPVLVRVRMDDIDRVQFALDSNIVPGEKTFKDHALTEAAKDKGPVFQYTRNIQEILTVIRTLRGQASSDDDIRNAAMLVRAYRDGEIPLAKYKKQIKALIGSRPDEKVSAANLAFFLSRTLGFIGNAGFGSKAIFKYVLLQGGGWDIPQLWDAWDSAEGIAEKQRTAAALYTALKPLLKEGKAGTNFAPGGYQFWAAIMPGVEWSWQWYHDRYKFAASTASPQEQQELYGRHLSAGVRMLPNIDNDVILAKQNLAQIFSSYVGETLRGNVSSGVMSRQTYNRMKEILESGQFGPSDAGNDGYLTLIDECGFELQSHVTSAIEPLKAQLSTARQILQKGSPVSLDDARELAHGIVIDKTLEKHHAAYMGEGLLRQWIAECFHLLGGCPASLKSFELHSGTRAYASASDQTIVMNARTPQRTIWHEIGHHYEFSVNGALDAAKGFLQQRDDRPNTLRRLKGYSHDNYGNDEVCISDHLLQPYAGKVYSKHGIQKTTCTEVFSIGIEFLSGVTAGALSLANNDNLIEFVLSFIKENKV
ncbi:TPA: hypothetical protein ACGQ50_000880 [Enterobacter cloacae]